MPSKELPLRFRAIVELVSQALSNREIAVRLRLSEGTVRTYMAAIFQQLHVSNRTELALWFLQQKAAEPPTNDFVI